MKVYVAFRHTGADETELHRLLTAACDALRQAGVEPVCTHFDIKPAPSAQPMTPRNYMDEGFAMIAASDVLLVLQASEERSEGMLMEVGYGLAKGMSVVVATQEDVKKTYLPSMGMMSLRWTDHDDLARKIAAIDFGALV